LTGTKFVPDGKKVANARQWWPMQSTLVEELANSSIWQGCQLIFVTFFTGLATLPNWGIS
jgi:hypothetical protein